MDKIIEKHASKYSIDYDEFFRDCFTYCVENDIDFTQDLKKELSNRYFEALLESGGLTDYVSNTKHSPIEVFKIINTLKEDRGGWGSEYFTDEIRDLFFDEVSELVSGCDYIIIRGNSLFLFTHGDKAIDELLVFFEIDAESEDPVVEFSYGYDVYDSDFTRNETFLKELFSQKLDHPDHIDFSIEKLKEDLESHEFINYKVEFGKEVLELISKAKFEESSFTNYLVQKFSIEVFENDKNVAEWVQKNDGKLLHLKLCAYSCLGSLSKDSSLYEIVSSFREDCIKSISKVRVGDLGALAMALRDPGTSKKKCLSIIKKLDSSDRFHSSHLIDCENVGYAEGLVGTKKSHRANLDDFLEDYSKHHGLDIIQSLISAKESALKEVLSHEHARASYFGSHSNLFGGVEEYVKDNRVDEVKKALKRINLNLKDYIDKVIGRAGSMAREIVEFNLPKEMLATRFRSIDAHSKLKQLDLFEWYEFDKEDLDNSLAELVEFVGDLDVKSKDGFNYLRYIMVNLKDNDTQKVIIEDLSSRDVKKHSPQTFALLPVGIKKKKAKKAFDEMTPGQFKDYSSMLTPYLPEEDRDKSLAKIVKTVSGAEEILHMPDVTGKMRLRALRKCIDAAGVPIGDIAQSIPSEHAIELSERVFKKRDTRDIESYLAIIDIDILKEVIYKIPQKNLLKHTLLNRFEKFSKEELDLVVDVIKEEERCPISYILETGKYGRLEQGVFSQIKNEIFKDSKELKRIFIQDNDDLSIEKWKEILGDDLFEKLSPMASKEVGEIDEEVINKFENSEMSLSLLDYKSNDLSESEIMALCEAFNNGMFSNKPKGQKKKAFSRIPESYYGELESGALLDMFASPRDWSPEFDLDVYRLLKSHGLASDYARRTLSGLDEGSEEFEIIRSDHRDGIIDHSTYISAVGVEKVVALHINGAMVSLLRDSGDEDDNEFNLLIIENYIKSFGASESIFDLITTEEQLNVVLGIAQRLGRNQSGSRGMYHYRSRTSNLSSFRYEAFLYFEKSSIDVSDLFMDAYKYYVGNKLGGYEKSETFLADRPSLAARYMRDIALHAKSESSAELNRVLKAFTQIKDDIDGFQARIYSLLMDMNEYEWIPKILGENLSNEDILKELSNLEELDERVVGSMLGLMDKGFVESNYNKVLGTAKGDKHQEESLLYYILATVSDDRAREIIIEVEEEGRLPGLVINGEVGNTVRIVHKKDSKDRDFTYSFADNKVLNYPDAPDSFVEKLRSIVEPYVDISGRVGVVCFETGMFKSDDLELSLERNDVVVQSVGDDSYIDVALEFNLAKKAPASLSVSVFKGRAPRIIINVESVGGEQEAQFEAIDESIKKDVESLSVELGDILGELGGDKPFGIEIEYSSKISRKELAKKLSKITGIEIEGSNHYFSSSGENWDIKYDGSVDGISAELVSPKLYGEEGVSELTKVLKGVSKVNEASILSTGEGVSCGIHVHHEAKDIIDANEHMKEAFKRGLFKIQGALYEICNSKRASNSYSRKMGISQIKGGSLPRGKDGFNFTRYGTLEFRMKEGTFDTESILRWVRITREVMEILRREIFEKATESFDSVISAVVLERAIQHNKKTPGFTSLEELKRNLGLTNELLKAA